MSVGSTPPPLVDMFLLANLEADVLLPQDFSVATQLKSEGLLFKIFDKHTHKDADNADHRGFVALDKNLKEKSSIMKPFSLIEKQEIQEKRGSPLEITAEKISNSLQQEIKLITGDQKDDFNLESVARQLRQNIIPILKKNKT